ncbi:hypothetical protein [Microbulbifer sp. SSSA005]
MEKFPNEGRFEYERQAMAEAKRLKLNDTSSVGVRDVTKAGF